MTEMIPWIVGSILAALATSAGLVSIIALKPASLAWVVAAGTVLLLGVSVASFCFLKAAGL